MTQKRAVFVPVNSSPLQEKFIRCMMIQGKKSTSRRILKDCFAALKEKGHKQPEEIFEKAIKNIMPQIEVRPRRVGGAVYQIPMEVKPHRQQTLSIRWLLEATRKRKGKSMAEKLAEEIIEAASEAGEACKKRENVHKMAQANRAFAHFARF